MSSRKAMEKQGWVFDMSADDRCFFTGERCSTAYGYSGLSYWWRSRYGGSGRGWTTNSVSTIFRNSGQATLQFANCYNSGEVKVYLNNSVIATSTSNGRDTKLKFTFSIGSNVTITTDTYSIIKLNSFSVSCGKF